VFTLPAFLISHAWASFSFKDAYWKSTVLMLVGSVLGVLFVSLVRRVMVEDPELPFPESVAASEIHKAGQRGAERQPRVSGRRLHYRPASRGVAICGRRARLGPFGSSPDLLSRTAIAGYSSSERAGYVVGRHGRRGG
jgi:uncharacterized oligopeptide transporter (OPT) family protein